MKERQDFKSTLIGKTVPLLVLDQKWHRLFAVHGKTDEIKELEAKLNSLLAEQGRLNTRLKELKKLKGRLLDEIVQGMEDKDAKVEENKRLVDEINQKMEECEDELMDIPHQIRETNDELMVFSMDYFYEKIRVNQTESAEIEEWINQVRVDLKKNIIRKQNRDINNREIYAYLHDIFGPEVINIFDIKYDEEKEETT
jgi:chromosome segregation ATPase